jgi:hypothetical protein
LLEILGFDKRVKQREAVPGETGTGGYPEIQAGEGE